MNAVYLLAYEGVHAAWIVALAAGALSAARREREGALPARADVGLGAALVVVAFLLRWLLPPHALVYENGHAWAFAPQLGPGATGERFGLPSSHLVLANGLRWVGRGDTPFFVLGALSSSFATVGVFGALRAIGVRRLPSLAAGGTWCVLPLAIALAPTEEPLVFASGLFAVGLAMLASGARRDDVPALVCGASCVALAAMARIPTLPLAAAIPLAYAAGLPNVRRARWVHILPVLLLPTVLLLPRLFLVGAADEAVGVSRFATGVLLVEWPARRWALGLAPLVPRWVTLTVVAGMLGAVATGAIRRSASLPLLVVGAYVVAQGAGSLVTGAWYPAVFRHQYVGVAAATLAVGAVPVALGALFRSPRLEATLSLLLIGLAALTPVLSTDAASPRTPATDEYAFALEAADRIPPGSCVVSTETLGTQNQAEWFVARRPDLSPVEPSEIPHCLSDGRHVAWFLGRGCFTRVQPTVDNTDVHETPMVRVGERTVQPACAEVLAAHPWHEALGRDVPSASLLLEALARHGYDGRMNLPADAESVRLALLELAP